MVASDPLLELQRIDLADAALRAERAALPERAALAEGREVRARLDAEREAAAARLAPLAEAERRLEAEVSALRERARETENTLYSGTVRVASELADLQASLSSLQRQRSALEDEHLSVLEQQEALEGEIRQLDARRAELGVRERTLGEVLAAGEARLDARLEAVRREREACQPRVPATRLAAYERLRSTGRTLAAAALESGACGACHTTLPITHVSRIRAAGPDEVVTCESCQRLLVWAPDPA